jgi:hypothetical protein
MHMWALTTQLIAEGIRPKGCVYLWPGPNRVACFNEKNYHSCWGPWTGDDQGNLGPWAQPHHGEAYFNLVKASVAQQWPQGMTVRHWTWNDYTIHTGGSFDGPLLKWTDHARDLIHPGPISSKAWAEAICKGI